MPFCGCPAKTQLERGTATFVAGALIGRTSLNAHESRTLYNALA